MAANRRNFPFIGLGGVGDGDFEFLGAGVGFAEVNGQLLVVVVPLQLLAFAIECNRLNVKILPASKVTLSVA